MAPRSTPRPSHRRHRAVFLAALLFAALVGGVSCGRKGDPHPKSDLHGRVDSGK